MRQTPLTALVLPILLAFSSCGGSSGGGGGGPLASASIDAAGGTVAVTAGTYAGTSIMIPAGALAAATDITISAGAVTAASGFTDVGPAALLGPAGTTFAMPVTVVVPFDPARVPGGGTAGLVVKVRNAQGQISDLTPTQTAASTVTVQTSSFSTFWVAAPAPMVATADYLPLQDGNTYTFDNGMTIAVSSSTTEPNLGGTQVYTLLFQLGPDNSGTYVVRETDMSTTVRGSYSLSDSDQQVHGSPATWLPAMTMIGGQAQSMHTYTGYEPYGSTTASYTGNETLTTTFVSLGPITTPLGTFTDVLEVQVAAMWSESTGESGMNTETFWFARDVGPIRVNLEDVGVTSLTSGMVGGQAVQAQ